MALARAVWEAERARDWARLDDLLAPDYTYFSSRGRGPDRTKGEELALQRGVVSGDYELTKMRARRVAPDVIVLHYLADFRLRIDTADVCPHAGAMEVWGRRDGRWRQVARTEYLIGVDRPPPCGVRK